MGYYTRYAIKIVSDPNKELMGDDSLHQRVITYLNDNEDMLECFDLSDFEESNLLNTEDTIKWYDHEEYMKKMSLEIRDVLFELMGEGEDKDDLWKKYFLNGKMQTCYAQITFPEFDIEKMK